MAFKEGKAKGGLDKRGKVLVKIILLDEKAGQKNWPVMGNRKEEIVLDDATVGDVYESVKGCLFPEVVEDEEPKVNELTGESEE